MEGPRRLAWVAAGAAALLTTGPLFGVGATRVAAADSVSTVTGSAYGYRAFSIAIFGGGQSDTGPKPTVTLASDASNSPQSGTVTTAIVSYGPAVLFTSDAISVQTSGSLGTTGSVASTSSVKDVNKATTQPTSTGSEPLTADTIAGSCSASTTATTGSTTVTNGTLRTDNGLDLNGDGDFTDQGEHPPVTVAVPATPAANTTISGHIHVNGATDSFHYVFNEQSTSGGVLTVNPVHEYFDGPTLTGNLIIGQVVCGVNASSTTSTSSSSTSTNPSSSTTTSSSATGAVSGVVTAPSTGSGGGGMATGTVLAVLGGSLISAAFLARRRGRKGDDPEAG